MNITSVKAELIAICIGLIEDKDNQNIIFITDSFSTTRKVIKSYIIPFQKIIIPLVMLVSQLLSQN